jgi:membrane associated rhomboid family serine protease
MRYPPLEHWPRYPVTVGIAIGAAALTGWWWHGADVDHLMMGDQFWSSQMWQPFTCCLLHGTVLHLLFNVIYLWVFGALFEEVFGSGRFFATVIFLAFGSSVAEYAFCQGGVGLSGINYGLFGLLWVLSRKDRRFFGTLDRQTVHLLVGWFFFCIATTVANVMAVANVAHGAGAILGVMLGFALVEKNKRRKFGYISLIAFTMLTIVAAATVGRKYVNFSSDVQRQEEKQAYMLARQGYKASLDNRDAEAAEYYLKALAIDDSHGGWWFNLALSYTRLGKEDKAIDAFKHAAKLQPDNEKYKAMSEFFSTLPKMNKDKQKPEE